MVAIDEAYYGDDVQRPMTIRELVHDRQLPVRLTYLRPKEFQDYAFTAILIDGVGCVVLLLLVMSIPFWNHVLLSNVGMLVGIMVGAFIFVGGIAVATYKARQYNKSLLSFVDRMKKDHSVISLTGRLVHNLLLKKISGELYVISTDKHGNYNIPRNMRNYLRSKNAFDRGDGEGEVIAFFKCDDDYDRVLFCINN